MMQWLITILVLSFFNTVFASEEERWGIIRDEGPVSTKTIQEPVVIQEEKSVSSLTESESELEPEPEAFTDVVEPDHEFPLDILVVLDNSNSMKPILQTYLSINPLFKEILELMDWRMGFIPAEPFKDFMYLEHGSRLLDQQILTKGLESYESIIRETMSQDPVSPCLGSPGCGGAKERPLFAVQTFLQSNRSHLLIREKAGLAVIIITDNKESTVRKRGMPLTDIVADLYGTEKPFRVYTLTVLSEQCAGELRSQQGWWKEAKPSPQVRQLGETTGGGNFDLCRTSYLSIEEEIKKDFLE